ncbi:uncharacterized protein LOC116955077 [Petromyzon marinus]|uniref:uncharacterized protein LOC116955077 n=1 Tax=Petromyzon marinus TaxID=7757 RepID=UPI003F70BCFE
MTMRLCALLLLPLLVIMGSPLARRAAKSAPNRTYKTARPLPAPPSPSSSSSSSLPSSSSSSSSLSSGAASSLASSKSSSASSSADSSAPLSSSLISSSSSSSSSASGRNYCLGYFDVMGLWDPPFSCNSTEYRFCCGTCSMRYCCNVFGSQLNQSVCHNYKTPNWASPTANQMPTVDPDSKYDPAMDRTNLVVYVVFGVIALALLSAVLAKVVLRRVTRAARDIIMPKALSGILRHQPRRCRDEEFRGHPMHATPQSREDSTARSIKNHSEKPRVNNIHMTMALMTPLAPSESHQHLAPSFTAAKSELARFNSLKRLADKELSEYYAKKHHLVEMASCGTLPLRVPHPDRQQRGGGGGAGEQQQWEQREREHWEQWDYRKQRPPSSAAAAAAAHVRTYGSTPTLADVALAPYVGVGGLEANGQADGYPGKQRLLHDFLQRDPRVSPRSRATSTTTTTTTARGAPAPRRASSTTRTYTARRPLSTRSHGR